MSKPQSRSVAAVIAAVSLVAGLTSCTGGSPEQPAATEEQSAPATEEAATAEDVKAGIEANFPGGLTSSSPLFVITEYEDVSPGTVRVHAQENLDDAGREEIARQVFNMSGTTAEELSTVVVRDASGEDSNHRR